MNPALRVPIGRMPHHNTCSHHSISPVPVPGASRATSARKSAELVHAVTGVPFATASTGGIDFKRMVEHARSVGGPKLRKMTFHERALMLKAMAKHLMEKKDEFYRISAATGATKRDGWVDIEGGIGTLFAYASRGRREFPNETFHVEGVTEPLSKGGTFVGKHICVPLESVAVHINPFNFPVWGMLEKLAPTLLAGVPAIVKPATLTSFLTESVFAERVASGLFPQGSIQLLCGSAGDLIDHLDEQCAVAFTGSAATGRMLKTSKSIVENSVRFNQEADSLNFSMLGPDAAPGTEEFDLFIREVANEMTTKAGAEVHGDSPHLRSGVDAHRGDGGTFKAPRGREVGDPAVEGVRM
jgi:oxepin-CoA hydrolase/3-oxo-5,6-dehydrosuberyl-CoA semialdehyde dehydrogenase